MRERTINLKIYSRALRVRSMGSHCSPRLDTSRYLFNTDISFLGKKDTGEESGRRCRMESKSFRQNCHSFSDVAQVGKLITNSIFHFHRAESAIEWEQKNQREKLSERWLWKNSKIVFHTWTDVPFTQLTDIFICPQMHGEEIILQHMHTLQASLDTHINILLCQRSWREVWVAQSSV